MKKNKSLFIVSIALMAAGFIGIVSLGFLSVFLDQRDIDAFAPSMGMGSGGDRHFIEQMIPHHEDAVRMAELALTQAEHEELRQLAEAIIENQSREINDMQAWYQSWYGKDVPASASGRGRMGRGMMGNDTDLQSLEAAEQFDKEFIEQMIPHHEMAIMMASMLLGRTQREEMQNLAQDILRIQTQEIKQMYAWYNDWY
jgi:uncharacterized protein (DUF305 family)